MKTRDEIFGIYLDFYSSDVKVRKISNPFIFLMSKVYSIRFKRLRIHTNRFFLKLFCPTQSERLSSTKLNPSIQFIRKKAMPCLATMNMIINGMRTI